MPPALMPLAALTVMLWILWSDSLRRRRQHRVFYFVRVALYLMMAVVIAHNLIRYPELFNPWSRFVSFIATAVGIGGAVFFFRRATATQKPELPERAPPP